MNELPVPSSAIDGGQLRNLDLPFLDQYFGVWAMELNRFMLGYEHVRRMNMPLHLDARRTAQAEARSASAGKGGSSYGYSLTPGGVAIVDLVGTMMKQETSLGASTSTVKLRRTLRALADDPNVKAVLMTIDSPGGTSAGTGVLSDEIARLATKKPINAYVEDGLCASAAYWAGSQCSFISCDPRALVGSIGTYAVIEDSSVQAAKAGVTVHLVKAGKWKGAGVDGTPVSAEQLARWQALVDETNSHFLAAVGRGRKMSVQQVAALDADVFMGQKAKAAGLVDAVESFDEALARLENTSPAGPVQAPTLRPRQTSSAALSESPGPINNNGAIMPRLDAVGTFVALVDQKSKSGLTFRAAFHEAKRTNHAAYLAYLSAGGITYEESGEPSGVAPSPPASRPQSPGPAVDAPAAYLALVAKHRGRGKVGSQAHREAARERPDLHAAWLQSVQSAPAALAPSCDTPDDEAIIARWEAHLSSYSRLGLTANTAYTRARDADRALCERARTAYSRKHAGARDTRSAAKR